MRRAELAAAIGRSAKQINKLVDAGMPVARRGARGAPHGYRLEDVEAWLAARDETMQPGEFFDAVRERALKERAQRHLAEQMLKVRAGELVAKDEVIAEWSGHAAAVRTKLVAIPSMLDIDAKTTGALDALIRQVLEELADGNDEPLVEAAPKCGKRGGIRRRKLSRGCVDCGADISARHGNARRCTGCNGRKRPDVRPERPVKAKRKAKK